MKKYLKPKYRYSVRYLLSDGTPGEKYVYPRRTQADDRKDDVQYLGDYSAPVWMTLKQLEKCYDGLSYVTGESKQKVEIDCILHEDVFHQRLFKYGTWQEDWDEWCGGGVVLDKNLNLVLLTREPPRDKSQDPPSIMEGGVLIDNTQS